MSCTMARPRSSRSSWSRLWSSGPGVEVRSWGRERAGCLPLKWSFTARGMRARRWPLQSGQRVPESATSSSESMPKARRRAAGSSASLASSSGTSIQGKTRPWPRQVGHQPRGELCEKCLGSSSGKLSPVSASVRVVENHDRTSPLGLTRKQEPLPRRRASSSAAKVRSDFLRSATTTSTSCSE